MLQFTDSEIYVHTIVEFRTFYESRLIFLRQCFCICYKNVWMNDNYNYYDYMADFAIPSCDLFVQVF